MARPARTAHRRPRRLRDLRKEDGYVLALTALLIIPLALFTGFAVDLGAWYGRAAQIQRASDAAALAGVTKLPDVNQATTLAQQVATQNGFTDGVNGVTVTVTQVSDNQLNVKIRDTQIQQYFSQVAGQDADFIERGATGQYILPIPMGSPNNYLGTKDMWNVGGAEARNENFWLAASGKCVSRSQGERLTAGWESTTDACTGGSRIANPEFSTTQVDDGYFYVMEVKNDYIGVIDLQVYDAPLCGNGGAFALAGRPSTNSNGNQETGSTTSTIGQYTFIVRNNDSFNPGAATILATHNLGGGSITSSGSGTNRCGSAVDSGGSGPNRWQCTNDISGSAALSQSASDSSTNWASCWHTLRRFTNPTKGRYFVQVKVPPNGVQTNQFALRAKTGGASGNTFVACSSDPTDTANYQANCPQVYAQTYMGVYATIAGNAPLYLAEVGPAHLGKYLNVVLWDSGEGASSIQLLNPAGTAVNFKTEIMCNDGTMPSGGACTTSLGYTQATPSGGWGPLNGTSLNVSGTGTQPWTYVVGNSKYNDRLVRLSVKIGDNNGDGVIDEDPDTPFGGKSWWKIQYTTAGTPTDRTTWAVSVVGSPVRLTPDVAP